MVWWKKNGPEYNKHGKYDKYDKYDKYSKDITGGLVGGYIYVKTCHTNASKVTVPDVPGILVFGSAREVARDAHTIGVQVVYACAEIFNFDLAWKKGWRGRIIGLPIRDFGTLPQDVLEQYANEIAGEVRSGKVVAVCCAGGHGRTGYVGASVLGLLGVEDPIAFIREKHCKKAVESAEQLEAIAALLGKPDLAKKHQPAKEGVIYDGKWGTPFTCADCAHFTGPTNKCPVSGLPAQVNFSACYTHFQHKDKKKDSGKKVTTNPLVEPYSDWGVMEVPCDTCRWCTDYEECEKGWTGNVDDCPHYTYNPGK